jgi:hypothetical protein
MATKLQPHQRENHKGLEIEADWFTGSFNGVVSSLTAPASTAVTFTATSGTLPTPDGATTFANAATPTVAELLDAVVELRTKLAAVQAALT